MFCLVYVFKTVSSNYIFRRSLYCLNGTTVLRAPSIFYKENSAMAFVQYNEHPYNDSIDDCVLRAIAKFFNITWDEAYLMVMMQGYDMKKYPTNRNDVWGTMLHEMGCDFYYVPNMCPMCITVEKFANDHPRGRYILGTTTHAVAVIDGIYYDTWDSGQEYPVYYFTMKGED